MKFSSYTSIWFLTENIKYENDDAPQMVQKKPVLVILPFKGDSYTFTMENAWKISSN